MTTALVCTAIVPVLLAVVKLLRDAVMVRHVRALLDDCEPEQRVPVIMRLVDRLYPISKRAEGRDDDRVGPCCEHA